MPFKAGDTFNRIDGQISDVFSAQLLAPAPHEDDEYLEEALSKNESSIIMNMKILPSAYSRNPMHFLLGGDAEVLIWERLWDRYKSNAEALEYDLLLTPHHCSWHSLSYDSWSQWGENAEVCDAARNALGQARSGATIVSSSNQILDDDYDPPCIRAKREYEDILDSVDGWFSCTGDLKDTAFLEFEVAGDGKLIPAIVGAVSAAVSAATAAAPRAGVSNQ